MLQARFSGVKAALLLSTALVAPALGASVASAEQAANCTPSASTSSGTVTCTAGTYTGGIYFYPDPQADINLTVQAGAVVTGVANTNNNNNNQAGIEVGYDAMGNVAGYVDANVSVDSAAIVAIQTGPNGENSNASGLIALASGQHAVVINNTGSITAPDLGLGGAVLTTDQTGTGSVSITNGGQIAANGDAIIGEVGPFENNDEAVNENAVVSINNTAALGGLTPNSSIQGEGIAAFALGGNTNAGTGTSSVQITNSGPILTSEIGIYAVSSGQQSAVLNIQNSGSISDVNSANLGGILGFVLASAANGTASVTITNSGVISAVQSGVSAAASGQTANVAVVNSGSITLSVAEQGGLIGEATSANGTIAVTNTASGVVNVTVAQNDSAFGILAEAGFLQANGATAASTTTASVAVENDGVVTVQGSAQAGTVGVLLSSAQSSSLVNTGTITVTDADAAVEFQVPTPPTNNDGVQNLAVAAVAPAAAPAGIPVSTAPATLINSGLIENTNGTAVLGADQPTTITNAGTIVGGGGTAIQFGAAANTLILEPGSVIQGLVTNGDTTTANDANGNPVTSLTVSTNNTFALGGTGTATFDISQVAETPAQLGGTPTADGTQEVFTPPPTVTQQYQGFSNFVKFGPSTWVLTYGDGGGLADQNWTILGGVLQGNTNSIRGASIKDGGTLAFVQDFDGTYAGTVSDAPGQTGAFFKGGAGTLTLTAPQSYSGATTVAAGDMRAGGAGVFSAASITTIEQGATLDLGGFAQTINTVNLAGGTLGNGPLAGTVNSTGGTISSLGGTASLNVTAGLTNAVNVNTYTGPTTITGGDYNVLGSVTASNITASNGGILSGTGKIGDPTIAAGGILAPGTPAAIGTLTIVGPLTFQAGSTYQVRLTPTVNDRTNVTGVTTINGGTVNVLAGTGTYSTTQRYTLLTATGGVDGRFTALTATTNLAFLNPTLSYDANDVYLGFTPNPFVTVANTPNERAAASGLQSLGATNPLYGAVLNLTAPNARAAFNALSGEIHASAVTAGIEDSRFPREAIFDRLDDAAATAPAGALGAVGPFGTVPLPPGAQGYAPVHKGYDMPVAAPLTPAPTPYTVWGQGFGDFGRNGGNGNAATLDRSLGGFVLGADARIDSSYFNAWRIGLAGGYTSDDLRVSGRASTGTFETYFGGLYAGARYGAIDIKLGVLGGGTNTETNRTIVFPGFLDATRSNYGGDIVQGFGEVGYKFGLPRGFIEPVVQGAVIHIDQDGFTEAGGLAALRGFGHGTDVETATFGFRAEGALPFGNLPLFAKAFLGYRHAFGDVDPRSTLAFTAGGTPFTVSGAPIDRDAVYAEAGLDYRATSNLTIGIKYSGQAGERADDNAVKGGLEYKF